MKIRNLLSWLSIVTIMLTTMAVFTPVVVHAEGGASAVGLIDPDTAGFGIDGRDVRVSWTAATSELFAGYYVFVLPEAAADNALSGNAAAIITTGCGGSGCSGSLVLEKSNAQFDRTPGEINDGAGNPFAPSTNYKACVLTTYSSGAPDLACSGVAQLSSEADIDDANGPNLNHFPGYLAPTGVDYYLYAEYVDDVATPAQAQAGTAGAAFQLKYIVRSGPLNWAGVSTVNGTVSLGSWFEFVVPDQDLSEGQLAYYFIGTDIDGNTTYLGQNGPEATEAAAQAIPFTLEDYDGPPADITIGGTVTSGFGAGSPVTAKVFVSGWAVQAVDNDGDGGTYTTANVPNSMFELVAFADGKAPGVWQVDTVNSQESLTGQNISIPDGPKIFQSNSAISAGVFRTFSGPPSGSSGVPLNETIRLGFSAPMQSVSCNSTNIDDCPVKLMSGANTVVDATVQYCEDADDSGTLCSQLFPGDTNTYVIDPTADLTQFVQYRVQLQVTSADGGTSFNDSDYFFTPGGAALADNAINTANFGTGTAMPPMVQSVIPSPGSHIPTTVTGKLVFDFNGTLDSTTLTTSNIVARKITNGVVSDVTLTSGDIVLNSDKKKVTVTFGTPVSGSEYEVCFKGAVKGTNGVKMLFGDDAATSDAFCGFVQADSNVAVKAITIFPLLAVDVPQSGQQQAVPAAISLQQPLVFGFSEPISESSLNSSTVTFKKQGTTVGATLDYNVAKNELYVCPTSSLILNKPYVVTLTNGVQSLFGGAPTAASNTYTYTTSTTQDSTTPAPIEARCDDDECVVKWPVLMNTATDANAASSQLKSANWTVKVDDNTDGSINGSDTNLVTSSSTFSWDCASKSTTIGNLNATLTTGSKVQITPGENLADLVGNGVSSTAIVTKAEPAGTDFLNQGMFAKTDFSGANATAEFKPQGFGNFTAEQHAFGQADEAFPFNQMASQDVNVMHHRVDFGVAVEEDDQIQFIYPNGTGVTNVVEDSFSPFNENFVEFRGDSDSATVTFDDNYGTDGITANAATNTVTVQLTLSRALGEAVPLIIDLAGMTNPSIPKDPSSGGYTVTMKLVRDGEVLATRTSMPYFINAGGSNSLTVNVYAGSSSSPDAVTGSVFLFGGGPAGPLDKNLAMTNGTATKSFTSLPDGCYFVGTEPFVTIGGTDYFGKDFPEPVCLDSGNSSGTKNIVLTNASTDESAIPITVKFQGINSFGGADLDLMAGGPNGFVMRQLSNVTTPDTDGYTLRLKSTGFWHVGVGPGRTKGANSKLNEFDSGFTLPQPVELDVRSATDIRISSGQGSASINTNVTPPVLTFQSQDISGNGTLTVSVSGGSEADNLQGVEVMLFPQGRGRPVFKQTDSNGRASITIPGVGGYDINVFKDGLPPKFDFIDIRPDGADAGTNLDVFYRGAQIADNASLNISLKKGDYSISGKVLDSNGSAITYAPVFASNAGGTFIPGQTDSAGAYTLFVDAGTWTVKSELPPDKSSVCGTLSKSVIVSTESKTGQDLRPVRSTCVEITGTVTAAGSAFANGPLMVEEWDVANNRPLASGFFRPTQTSSTGTYTAKVAAPTSGTTTYRVAAFSPEYGEMFTTTSVGDTNVSGVDITHTVSTITFAFTGGTSSHKGFIDVTNASNEFTRASKGVNDLSSSKTLQVPSGTYNYTAHVDGVGDFKGTVAAGATATIDLTGKSIVTVAGTVYDDDGQVLPGATVTVVDTTSGNAVTATSDEDGAYTVQAAPGTYNVKTSLAGYVPGQAGEDLTLTAATNVSGYDIGTSSGGEDTDGQKALIGADNSITGQITDGSNPVDTGYVEAENEDGIRLIAPINSDGSYDIPAVRDADGDGTADQWTVTVKTTGFAKKTVTTPVTLTEGADTTANVTVVSDATRISTNGTKSIAANTGGSGDNSGVTGIKVVADAGELESGSGNVTLTYEKTFDAPTTSTFAPLGDATYSVSATGSSTITDLNGKVDLSIEYDDLVDQLPDGVEETDLKCGYVNPASGEVRIVEGGFSVDATNNRMNCSTDHFTDFVIVYPNSLTASSTPTPTPTPTTTTSTGSTGGGGGAAGPSASSSSASAVAVEAASAPSSSVAEEVNLGAEGVVEKEVSLQSKDTKAFVTLPANTYASTADGLKYTGSLSAPTPVTTDVPAIEGSKYASPVYEIGAAGQKLTFNKKVKVVLPLNANVSTTAKLAVYTLEGVAVVVEVDGAEPETTTEMQWVKVADVEVKELNGKYVVEFETDHFSEYVVMRDTTVATTAVSTGTPTVFTSFKDTKGHWSASFVEDLFEKGIVSGYSATEFGPDRDITRAEFTKIAVTAFAIPTVKASEITFMPFKDVPLTQWFAPYVQAAYIWNVVEGYSDATFRPNEKINRAEAMKILLDAAKVDLGTPKNAGFPDVPKTQWFAPYVNYAAENGVVGGYANGKFGPGDNVTRGQVAKMVSLMMKLKGDSVAGWIRGMAL